MILPCAPGDHVAGHGLADVEDCRDVSLQQLFEFFRCGKSSSGVRCCMPALLTRMPMACHRPFSKPSTAASDGAVVGGVEGKLVDFCTFGPQLVSAAAASFCSSRPFRTTAAPACARPRARAKPIPWEEPVTSAVAPVRSKSVFAEVTMGGPSRESSAAPFSRADQVWTEALCVSVQTCESALFLSVRADSPGLMGSPWVIPSNLDLLWRYRSHTQVAKRQRRAVAGRIAALNGQRGGDFRPARWPGTERRLPVHEDRRADNPFLRQADGDGGALAERCSADPGNRRAVPPAPWSAAGQDRFHPALARSRSPPAGMARGPFGMSSGAMPTPVSMTCMTTPAFLAGPGPHRDLAASRA